MKNIATNVYSFENLIREGYTYVDKSQYLYQLINNTLGTQFFLSRPRRFGKSLLLSTIQCIFEGKRELFKGLYIDSTEYGWQTYPVIHLDMNNTAANTVEKMERDVKKQLKWNYVYHNIEIDMKDSAKGQFEDLIRVLAQKSPHKQVVLLIDEYDKPLLKYLGNEKVKEFQNFLKQFYGVVKSTESLQRFCLMTGVSKFSKVSIFSDLNNLVDITMSKQFSEICGFSHEEVHKYFDEHIKALAQATELSVEQTFEELCKMYDGYMFCENSKRLFNPVSLGNCFTDKAFNSYWFSTGTLGGLINVLKQKPMVLTNFEITPQKLDVYDPADPDLVVLLFQTGYLTIKDAIGFPRITRYVLDFPNAEVKDAFNTWLVDAYAPPEEAEYGLLDKKITKCAEALEKGDVETFINIFKSFLASVPYHILKYSIEPTYQGIMYAYFYSVCASINAETINNVGRTDIVMKSQNYTYIVELKVNKNVEEAMQQIKDKCYYEQYMYEGKKLILLAINFNSETRNIDEYVFEEIDSNHI